MYEYKKATAILITLLLIVLGLSACGGEDDSSSEAETVSTAVSEEDSGSEQQDAVHQMIVNKPGMATTALGTGIAKMLSEGTALNMQTREQPGGAKALAQLVNSGQGSFTVSQTRYDYDAYIGGLIFEDDRQENLRLIATGPPLAIGMVVKRDSSYLNVSDVAGARLPAGFSSSQQPLVDLTAFLQMGGLTWDDVQEVSVSDIGAETQAFMEGRVDVAHLALQSASAEEANASISGGIRFLSIPNDEQLLYSSPYGQGYWIVEAKKGSAPGVLEDINTLALRVSLDTNAMVDNEIVYMVTKAMWENVIDQGDIHPLFKAWNHESFVLANATLPYHPGAIQFYKEVGVWTDEMEQKQQELLQQ